MDLRAAPDEFQPPLTRRGQAWRLLVCLLISGLVWAAAAGAEWESHRGWFAAELGLGAAAYALVLVRRRAPVSVALAIAALSCGSGIAAGPATLAAVSVATQRRVGPILLVGLTNFAAANVYTFSAPFDLQEPAWVTLLINLCVNVAMMGWGMFIGSRRELVWTLRQRAHRAESEQELRVSRARSTERERIAREMHDVLAHRITQVSMQAGALAFRDDLGADELRRGLADIQGKANEAIHDLRGVLGVLRDATTGELVEGPQPTYGDIAALVAAARTRGMNVTLDDIVDHTEGPVPDAVGRTLYRVVQEGITNCSKHAPGALLSIRLSGDRAHGLEVVMRNPLGFGASGAPGSGLGLVGLAERAELRGGSLTHGRDGSSFALRASIPWTP